MLKTYATLLFFPAHVTDQESIGKLMKDWTDYALAISKIDRIPSLVKNEPCIKEATKKEGVG